MLDEAIAKINEAKEKLGQTKAEEKDEVKDAEKAEEKDEVKDAEKAEEKDEVKDAEKAEEKGDEYTVAKGDCVWNIAKADLTQKLGRKPTNAEILKRQNEIMELNKEVSDDDKKAGFVKLEWEDDHYHVMIRPGDKLKLTA